MKKLSRRAFLKRAGLATCGGAAHNLASPMLFKAYSFAQQFPAVLGANGVLIVINFSGGWPLNTVPLDAGYWNDHFPTTAYATSRIHTGDQGVCLHPSLTFLKEIWDEGKLAIFHNVGYRSDARGVGVNRSHAASRRIYEGGRPDLSTVSEGWLVRATQSMASIYSGISVGGTSFLIENASNIRAFSDIGDLNESSFKRGGDSKTQAEFWKNVRNNIITLGDKQQYNRLPFVVAANNNIDAAVDTIRTETNPETNPLPQPELFGNSNFNRQCEQAAQILNAPSLGVKALFLEIRGTDTHSDEVNRYSAILDDFNQGMRALYLNARGMGREDDLCCFTTSEFGRNKQNGAGGTDHGHGSHAFVFGGRVMGGNKNVPATETNWAGRSYIYNIDIEFPSLYGSLVQQGLGVPADQVFPGYAPLPVQIFT